MGAGSGKGSKTRAKAKSDAAKRARKQAMKAQYQAWAAEGLNKKSDRALKKSKKVLVSNLKHPNGACGNIGCLKCFPMGAPNPSTYRKPTAPRGWEFAG